VVYGEENATGDRRVHLLAELVAAAKEKALFEHGAAQRAAAERAVRPLESGVFASNGTSVARRSRKAANASACFSRPQGRIKAST
jgi:hypothetical protein